jgi:hypothetical protein
VTGRKMINLPHGLKPHPYDKAGQVSSRRFPLGSRLLTHDS